VARKLDGKILFLKLETEERDEAAGLWFLAVSIPV